MNADLGWRADGIERALAVGGVPLERYLRPGFVSGYGVRRVNMGAGGSGIYFDQYEDDFEYEDKRRRARRR